MGYDSNIKSDRAERRQQVVIIFSLITLSAICFLFVGVLHPGSSGGELVNSSGESQNSARLAATKALVGIKNSATSAKTTDKNSVPPRFGGKQGGDASRASEENLAAERRAGLEAKVRAIKSTGVIMEADEHSLEMTGELQDATRELLKIRYGDFGSKNYRVQMDLEFQSTIPDFEEKGKDGRLLLELAPISLIPCSVYNFLEIARTWKRGGFHRNAAHVLQATVTSDVKQSMPFQEYNEEYPHKQGTVGYAGRPSGPAFYVSIKDNTHNHGPGSQQKKNPHEADSVIGTIIEGGMNSVVPRIHKMPGKEFMSDRNKWVLIRRMHILIPGDDPSNVDGYVEFSISPETVDK